MQRMMRFMIVNFEKFCILSLKKKVFRLNSSHGLLWKQINQTCMLHNQSNLKCSYQSTISMKLTISLSKCQTIIYAFKDIIIIDFKGILRLKIKQNTHVFVGSDFLFFWILSLVFFLWLKTIVKWLKQTCYYVNLYPTLRKLHCPKSCHNFLSMRLGHITSTYTIQP